MKLRLLNSADLRQALPMNETIEEMKSAFDAFSSGRATVPQRLAIGVPSEDAVVLVKPALIPDQGLGAKLVSVFPNNSARGKSVISGVVILLDPETGEPVALCDGAFVTAWRTGAASGAATDVLARQDALLGAVIGCGAQGRTQVIGIDAARQLETIRVFDVRSDLVESLVAELGPQIRARLIPCASSEEAVEGADVICLATTSKTPVVESRSVKAGAHLNGVGSFTPDMCEVDGELIAGARVVVDSRESARSEAGELIKALSQGQTNDDWAELGEVVAGTQPGRSSAEEITFFKSVGLAVQDVAACSKALVNAIDLGIGTDIDFG